MAVLDVLEAVSLADVLIYVGVAVVSSMVFGLLCRSRSVAKQGCESTANGNSGRGPVSGVRDRPFRLRRRDQMLQIGRQVWRRMPSAQALFGADVPERKRVKKRQRFINLAKRILRLKDNLPNKKHRKGPPPAFLEADWAETQSLLPPEVFYMLKSVRVFGHFEKPLFLELCKHLETCFLPAGSTLSCTGQLNDSIYVVQSGKLHVLITDPQTGIEEVIKEVPPGENVYSLLSILDCITGHPQQNKSVSARAVQNTTVLRLPAKAFEIVFSKYPDSLVRIVQIIMVRLQRVTFLALNKFLGLSVELLKTNAPPLMSNLDVLKLAPNLKGPSGNQSDDETVDLPQKEDGGESLSREHSLPIDLPVGGENQRDDCPSPFSPIDQVSADFEEACYRAGVDRPQFFLGSSDDEDVVATVLSQQERCSPIGEPAIHGNVDETAAVGPHGIPNSKLLQVAEKDISTLLGLKDSTVLKGRLCLQHVPADFTLVHDGDLESYLYFVLIGCLSIKIPVSDDDDEVVLYHATPGKFVGVLYALTGERSMVSVTSDEPTTVVGISKVHFYSLLRVRPRAVLSVGYSILMEMSPFVRQIDYALDWELVEAGRAVYRQGDSADCMFIVLNGRLRSVVKHKGDTKELVGEFGRGETVGVAEVLTSTPSATTVHAVRDTELARLPRGLLNYIKRTHPQVVTQLIRWLGHRLLGAYQRVPALGAQPRAKRPVQSSTNLATVAVLPVSPDVPLSNFTTELCRAINDIAPALRLTSTLVQERLGSAALDSIHEYRLLSWLGQQEDQNGIVLFQTDKIMSTWTQRCIRQADCILIVGLGDKDPAVGELEAELDKMAVRAQKELVLLHRWTTHSPCNTMEWLTSRGWCSAHYHMRCRDNVFEETSMTEKEREKLASIRSSDKRSDFARLARRLTGTSVALVLGGGGARGCSHAGIIKVLEDTGIPIDMVGGVSIGALIGAIYCEERIAQNLWQRARDWAMRFGQHWRKVIDLTWPRASILSGLSINYSLQEVFKEKQIEDMWLPYFCVTTDISDSCMRIHSSGSLWRYVRASMTLSGYYPPLCDPEDGHYLMDGGYVNNLPADVMHSMGAQLVLAVDVGSRDETNLTNYGDHLSGWWLLWNKIWPWAKPLKVPDMAEIQSRLAYVSCVRQLEQVVQSDFVLYIRPPIDRFGTMAFTSFDEIATVGLEFGQSLVEKWKADATLSVLTLDRMSPTPSRSFPRARTSSVAAMIRRTPLKSKMSFPDLAEMASRIEMPSKAHVEGEDEFGITSSPETEAQPTCPYSKSLDFTQEMLGYSSDLSDDDSIVSADEATNLCIKHPSEDDHAAVRQAMKGRSSGSSCD